MGVESPVIGPDVAAVESDALDSFEMAVTWLLSREDKLMLSVGDLFAALWTLAPIQELVTALFVRDFPEGDDEWLGTRRIVHALTVSASVGLLSSRDEERTHGGRAVLTLASIEEVSRPWASLQVPLLGALPAAFAACPDDFWARLAANDPVGTCGRFLNSLVARWRRREDAESWWELAAERHPDFATASRQSVLGLADADHEPSRLSDFVRVHANLDGVADAPNWLRALHTCLRSGDFTTLPVDRSRPEW